MTTTWKKAYDVLAAQLAEQGLEVNAVKKALKEQRIETPSWGYGDCGTRFKVFKFPGAARNIHEKLEDAATVHQYTGVTPSVAVHIPWDKVEHYASLKEYAAKLGLTIGAVNPNLFQDDVYKFGSACHRDPAVRRKAVAHMLECVGIMKEVGSKALSLWFADGTNYAGQDSLRERKHRLQDALAEVYAALPADSRMLIEYKCFEPASYATDIPDWGLASVLARRLGPKAQVLVDLGHHLPGANIEQIVAYLMDETVMGGFHFNNRKYADDDLIVGSVNPFELFLIYNEIVEASLDPDRAVAACARNIAYMIDQSPSIEPKLEGMIISVMNCQTALAKALVVDRKALAQAREKGEVVQANRVLFRAFETDVSPLLAQVRTELGVPPDPLEAFRASGHAEKLAKTRTGAAK
jgi:L-rhamnose isomerase/sugar isomerase